MGSRVPNIAVPSIPLGQSLDWHSLQCELVTPLYGGGVQAGTVDKDLPIRVSSIRGQLRFWWRLLAKHDQSWGFKNDLTAIRKAESRLWGGAGDEVNASLVFLKVTDAKPLDAKPWAKYEPNPKGGFKTLPTAENWANVPYVLFPAQGKKPGATDSKEPNTLIKAGLSWTLKIAFDEQAQREIEKGEALKEKALTEQQKIQVWEAIRWWANFGGLGARTRRGLGAVQVTANQITPITAIEVQAVGCQLVLRPQSNNVYTAWTDAVNKLQRFRQVNVGRASHTNRSRWPEPDAIRRLTGQNSPLHAPVHQAGSLFPRAAFGLPIIFKFKDEGSGRQDEPAQSSLQPVLYAENKPRERMASPLILRPYFNGQAWQAAALLLPHQHVDDLQLKLIQGNRSIDVKYWNNAQAKEVEPIRDQHGKDALSAFLNYFEN